jgi:membrane protein required for colicin V production
MMNTVDVVVIAVIAISALIAFLRGFVREMLTIGSWLGAALVTLYGFPMLQPTFEQWIPSSKLAAHLVGGALLFIGSLIVFSVLSHMIARFVRGSALTAVDRSLGLLFGLLRGAVLVSLAYMIIVSLDPSLFAGARTVPMMARGAEILRSLAPKQLSDQITTQFPTQMPSAEDNRKRDAVPRPAYTKRESDALQRLMDAAAGK